MMKKILVALYHKLTTGEGRSKLELKTVRHEANTTGR